LILSDIHIHMHAFCVRVRISRYIYFHNVFSVILSIFTS
jgi:hypothetical protein